MKIPVIFRSYATYVKARCRNTSNSGYITTTEIEVAEADPGSIVPLYRYRLPDPLPPKPTYDRRGRKIENPHRPSLGYHLDGLLAPNVWHDLARIGSRVMRRCANPTATEIARAALLQPYDHDEPSLDALAAKHGHHRMRTYETRRQLDRDIEELTKAAQAFLIVGDDLWTDAREMIWGINSMGDGVALLPALPKDLQNKLDDYPDDAARFCVTALSEAQAAAHERRYKTSASVTVRGEIEALGDGPFFDPKTANLRKVETELRRDGAAIVRGALRDMTNLSRDAQVEMFAKRLKAAIDVFVEQGGGSLHERAKITRLLME